MVTQIKRRIFVNGTQLFITAAIVVRISKIYIIVCCSCIEKGNRATTPIITRALIEKGKAFRIAVFKNDFGSVEYHFRKS